MINPLSLVAAAVAVVVGIRCAILGCKRPASSSSVEIAPGVRMPLVFNGMSTDHGLWLASGGRGIDTAFLYGDELQRHVASGIAASGVEREEVFVTTKVNCCPTDRCSRFCAHPPRPTSAPPMSVHNGSEMLKHSLAMTGQRYVDPPLRAAAQDRLRRLLAARVDQQSRRAQPPCRPRGCRGAREDAGAGRLVGVPCPTPTHVHDASGEAGSSSTGFFEYEGEILFCKIILLSLVQIVARSRTHSYASNNTKQQLQVLQMLSNTDTFFRAGCAS